MDYGDEELVSGVKNSSLELLNNVYPSYQVIPMEFSHSEMEGMMLDYLYPTQRRYGKGRGPMWAVGWGL